MALASAQNHPGTKELSHLSEKMESLIYFELTFVYGVK